MAADKSTRPLTALAVSRMKVGDELADTGENRGLRVTRTKGDHRYWYRFADPATGRQKVYMEGKSHSEVAEELGLPLGTVKSRVRLAMSKLKVMLDR